MAFMSTYVDPSTDITGGSETGREPLAKTASYYRRSWSTGSPFKTTPAWNDLSHAPPSRRELIARPDLALVAMRRILGRVEGELAQEAAMREQQRLQREDRLVQIRARHLTRYEAQKKIGVVPPQHMYDTVLKQRTRRVASPTEQGGVHGDEDEQQLFGASHAWQAIARPSSCSGLTVELPERHTRDLVAASVEDEMK